MLNDMWCIISYVFNVKATVGRVMLAKQLAYSRFDVVSGYIDLGVHLKKLN
jgi:hypothetical protein